MQFRSKYNMIILCVHMCVCVCTCMLTKFIWKNKGTVIFTHSRQTVDGLLIHQVWRYNKETLSHRCRDKQVDRWIRVDSWKNPVCLWKFNYVLSSRKNRMEFSKKKKMSLWYLLSLLKKKKHQIYLCVITYKNNFRRKKNLNVIGKFTNHLENNLEKNVFIASE